MTAKGEDGSKQVVANTNRDKIIMLEYNYNTKFQQIDNTVSLPSSDFILYL
jgi:hypothetical protein